MVKNKSGNNNNFFLIAEAGINHGGNFQKAIELINAAKKTGAHAIKFQTYKTEKRVSRKNISLKYLNHKRFSEICFIIKLNPKVKQIC